MSVFSKADVLQWVPTRPTIDLTDDEIGPGVRGAARSSGSCDESPIVDGDLDCGVENTVVAGRI